jgi:hypothetical protein
MGIQPSDIFVTEWMLRTRIAEAFFDWKCTTGWKQEISP